MYYVYSVKRPFLITLTFQANFVPGFGVARVVPRRVVTVFTHDVTSSTVKLVLAVNAGFVI